MNRREFIKQTTLTVAALSAGKAFAGEYGAKETGELNRLGDEKNPSVLEQKHVPDIQSPAAVGVGEWFDVDVKIGFMKEHPSIPEHWITMIKLLADGKTVAKTEFERGGVAAPAATFRVRMEKSSTLEAVEHCNLHGTWISRPVRVSVS